MLGKITRRHGLAGNLVLKLDTDIPEFYKKIESVFVEINGLLVPFFIDKQQWLKGDTKLVGFKNLSEMQVDGLVGKDVYLPLSTLPELSGTSFYYHEVIGYKLVDSEGKDFGQIQSVNDQTAQHYFLTTLGETQLVVPIIKDWILEVDRDGKIIKMQLPDGLMEVFTQNSKKDE